MMKSGGGMQRQKWYTTAYTDVLVEFIARHCAKCDKIHTAWTLCTATEHHDQHKQDALNHRRFWISCILPITKVLRKDIKTNSKVTSVNHHAEIVKCKTREIKVDFATDELHRSSKITKLNQRTNCCQGAEKINQHITVTFLTRHTVWRLVIENVTYTQKSSWINTYTAQYTLNVLLFIIYSVKFYHNKHYTCSRCT